MSSEGGGPGQLVERLFWVCFWLLLASMALNGAVSIVQNIWKPLCIGAVVVSIVGLAGYIAWRRVQRW